MEREVYLGTMSLNNSKNMEHRAHSRSRNQTVVTYVHTGVHSFHFCLDLFSAVGSMLNGLVLNLTLDLDLVSLSLFPSLNSLLTHLGWGFFFFEEALLTSHSGVCPSGDMWTYLGGAR